MNILHFKAVDSTNNYLKENYQALPDKTCVIADHQTSGKGRLGRVWEDDSTQALFSILLKANLHYHSLEQYPLLAAKAVHQVLIQYLPNLLIKWPNDLVIHDKKMVGILTESILDQSIKALVIGIGININTIKFPSHLEMIATSLWIETHQTFDIRSIIENVIEAFEKTLIEYQHHSLSHIHYCNTYSSLKDRTITYNQGEKSIEGFVIEIDSSGALIVQTKEGKVRLNSGEVTLKK